MARLEIQTKATDKTKNKIIATKRGDDNMTTTRRNKTKMTWSEYKQKIKIPKKWGKRKTKINKRFCSKHGSRRQRYGHRSHNKRNK